MIDYSHTLYATVDEVIAILQKASADGYGDYIVGCNGEYYLARKDDAPHLNHKHKQLDLGGYV